MKRVSMLLMCLFALLLASQSAKAQEVTITLLPGYTWISYPGTDTLDFSAALGGFTPVQGDIIQSQWGNAQYRNGRWQGSISKFYPGYGYKYKSTRQVPVSVTFNAQQASSQVVVSTSEPMLITAVSAMGGGEVTTTDGTYILVKGLCWATHENPTTNDDFYQEAESGVGTFSISMTELNIATTYYVRAYAVTPNGTVYGDQKSFTTGNGIPEVSTTFVATFVHRAICSGTVTDNGGLEVTACGVCWSTGHNPTLSDHHTSDDYPGLGSFTCTLTGLTPNTTYYVRAYASTRIGTAYGEEVSFTTVSSSSVGQYVDLGLPSGTLWATCNVGAETPEEYGGYFAWGETYTRDYYMFWNYAFFYIQYYEDDYDIELIKYCNNSNYGHLGFIDNLTTLLPGDDAATVNWGADWRMPTKEEWQELVDNTTSIWVIQNGVNGRLFTASNGNSLFLPAAGDRCVDFKNRYGYEIGSYWSSSLNTNSPCFARELYFNSDNSVVGSSYRCDGLSVRAVRRSSFVVNATVAPSEGGSVSGGGTFMENSYCMVSATANEGYSFIWWSENGEVVSTESSYYFTVNGNRDLVANFVVSGEHSYVDLGLPSGTLWATCNLGAESPESSGVYFAWGETQPKDTYNWSTYQYCNGTNSTFTKYCNNNNYGYDGFTDNLTNLMPEDDVAMASWGGGWRMPTKAEWQELYQSTTHIWTTQNGVNGRLFTASNGNSVFIPASGYRQGNSLGDAGSRGYYWSSSLYMDNPTCAWRFSFYSGGCYMSDGDRCYGRTVRPVHSSQNVAPTGAINSKFTINEMDDQVFFSKGNLQYIGSASMPYWKFADNQWDVLGTTKGQNSNSQYADRDLFGWGTSGWNNGNTYYRPWDTNNSGGYGPPGQYDLTGSYANADWGVYNPISNGGNQANQWRTLTQSEWNYVFNTRSTTSGIRYAKANVNNVNGVILLPDDWNTSIYSLSNANSSGASFSSNTITASQWSTLEQQGAVFLPAAGFRYGTSVYQVGSDGYYWSASLYTDDEGGGPLSVDIHDSYLVTDDFESGGDCGFSVRLARVAEN